MTTTSASTLGSRHGQRVLLVARRLARGAGALAFGIGSRWNAFVDSGQLGPSPYQEVSRRTGSRF